MSLDRVILLCRKQDLRVIRVVMRDRNYRVLHVFAPESKREDCAGTSLGMDKLCIPPQLPHTGLMLLSRLRELAAALLSGESCCLS